jgi:hypothetical protein
MLEQPASGESGRQATTVVNKVLDDPRAGSIEETERALRDHHARPVIRIPWDLTCGRSSIWATTPSIRSAGAPLGCRSSNSRSR